MFDIELIVLLLRHFLSEESGEYVLDLRPLKGDVGFFDFELSVGPELVRK
jgi:hypothetical protein